MEGQFRKPRSGKHNICDSQNFNQRHCWVFKQYVEASERSKFHSEVRIEDGELRFHGSIEARFTKQVELAVSEIHKQARLKRSVSSVFKGTGRPQVDANLILKLILNKQSMRL
jgi:hypothetical protein